MKDHVTLKMDGWQDQRMDLKQDQNQYVLISTIISLTVIISIHFS